MLSGVGIEILPIRMSQNESITGVGSSGVDFKIQVNVLVLGNICKIGANHLIIRGGYVLFWSARIIFSQS